MVGALEGGNGKALDLRLEEIIQLSKDTLGLDVNREDNRDNYDKHKDFLKYQLRKHRGYKLDYVRQNGGRGGGITEYPFKNLLVDKSFLFSISIGETAIIINFKGTEKRIGRYKNGELKPIKERADDLVLLSQKSIGGFQYEENRTDYRLYQLFHRQHTRMGRPTFNNTYQSWQGLIDELGQYKEVKNYFGRVISYIEDVSQRKIANRIKLLNISNQKILTNNLA